MRIRTGKYMGFMCYNHLTIQDVPTAALLELRNKVLITAFIYKMNFTTYQPCTNHRADTIMLLKLSQGFYQTLELINFTT